MRAIFFKTYGEKAIEFTGKFPKPRLENENELLVQVEYASINPVDAKQASGSMKYFIRPPLPKVTGMDFSGTIVELGKNVTDFKRGARVYGRIPTPAFQGTHADLVKITDPSLLSLTPFWMTSLQAASIGVAAHTAWESFERMNLIMKHDEKVSGKSLLIIGCGGGVGLSAVQFARALGIRHLYGICSSSKAEFMKSTGVTVLDYNRDLKKQLTGKEGFFDAILDCFGGEEYYQLGLPLLKPHGKFISIVGKSQFSGLAGDALIGLSILCRKVTEPRYNLYLGLIEPGSWQRMTTFINEHHMGFYVNESQVYPIERALEAFQASSRGHVLGKVLISVAKQ